MNEKRKVIADPAFSAVVRMRVGVGVADRPRNVPPIDKILCCLHHDFSGMEEQGVIWSKGYGIAIVESHIF
jgi:hypothetical protein